MQNLFFSSIGSDYRWKKKDADQYRHYQFPELESLGNIADKNPQLENGNISNGDDSILNKPLNRITVTKEKDKEKDKEYNSTKNYKPVGIYNSDILQKIQNKFTT